MYSVKVLILKLCETSKIFSEAARAAYWEAKVAASAEKRKLARESFRKAILDRYPC